MGRPNTIVEPTFQTTTATATVITHAHAAATGKTHVLYWAIVNNVTGQTAANTVTVTIDGTATVYYMPLTATTTTRLEFPGGIWGAEGNALTVALSAADTSEVKTLVTKVESI